MREMVLLAFNGIGSFFKFRIALSAENFALRHQLCILQRSVKRAKVGSADRLRVVRFNVTTNPTSEWTAQQVVEAFPWDTTPRYLLRDRDNIYGSWFRQRVKNMGIEEDLTAHHSPWQNPYSKRIYGGIRRECLDRAIVFSEGDLRTVLKKYFDYYNRYRVHQSLEWPPQTEERFSLK